MRDYHKKHQELVGLFKRVKDIYDKEIQTIVAKVYRRYQNSKKKGQEIEFFFQVQDEPWEQAREQANGERRPHIFLEPKEIISLNS